MNSKSAKKLRSFIRNTGGNKSNYMGLKRAYLKLSPQQRYNLKSNLDTPSYVQEFRDLREKSPNTYNRLVENIDYFLGTH
jgi:hypothetical protein